MTTLATYARQIEKAETCKRLNAIAQNIRTNCIPSPFREILADIDYTSWQDYVSYGSPEFRICTMLTDKCNEI